MVDFHVHCEYSIDAEGSVERYAEMAFDRGLRQICFATHCDLDPDRRDHDGRVRLKGDIVDVTSNWLESYIREVKDASKAYLDRGLKILCGLEIGYVLGIEKMIEKIIASYPFDFILGGVHTLGGIDIVSPRESGEYFRTRTPTQLCQEYFNCLGHAVACGLFDCIAHIDIYKRCGLEFYGEPLNISHRGLIDPVLDEIAARNLCIELNSGALRKGLPSPYPSSDILQAARGAGVHDVTLGSDCHHPEDVGQGLDRCLELARSSGFDRVVVFERRTKQEILIEELYDERQENQRPQRPFKSEKH